ncbi:hypothetical protein D3C72_1891080 [compost metagenome]
MQAPHAAQPAVIVLALAAIVLKHLRVRQDQEALIGHPFQRHRGDVLGGDRAFLQEALALALLAEQHVGLHALRADAADLDAAVAVGDRQPFGKPDRRVLGHGVRGRADL